MSWKLSMTVTAIKFYTSILASVTLTHFQGHGRIKMKANESCVLEL